MSSKRTFTPHWAMTLSALLTIGLFVFLGVWQLQRAKEKASMLDQAANLSLQTPGKWKVGQALPLQYQPIVVKGEYLSPVLLLDNQHHQHQFGYHVITPLSVDKNQVILIDRGWIAGDLNRRQFPSISTPSQFLQISGQAYYPSNKEWVLGQEIEQKTANLIFIERINTQLISQFLHKSVYPFIIRLNKDEAYGYVREWSIVSMPPERHKAYAFQWFAMALAIFVIYVGLNLKKVNEKTEP